MNYFYVGYTVFFILNSIIILTDIWMECKERKLATREGGEIVTYILLVFLSGFGTFMLWCTSKESLMYIRRTYKINWSFITKWLYRDFTLCKKKTI